MIKIPKTIFSIIYIIITYSLFLLSVKAFSFLHFSIDLLFFFSIVDIFILLHFLLDIKKMYDFIYKKRYIIGLIALSILVIGKYNGSSTYLWNNIIEPEYQIENSIILGKDRPIRSDEWLVGTPETLTQATDAVNFSSHNTILRGTDNLVTLFPNLPSKDISILAQPNNIGFLFLDTEKAYSLSWYLPYFILFFASFELLMIITNKRQLHALTGAILITLSPVVQWWQQPYIIAYGCLALVIFNYFLKENKTSKKLLLSVLFGYSGFLYIMCLYPAWQVPYGYCFLIMLIWILYKNRDKAHVKDLIYLIPAIITIALPVYLIFKENLEVFSIVNNTVYPGARFSTGGGQWQLLFTYVIDIFLPYKDLANPCELSQYISLFPIPLLLGIYLIIKNLKKKKDLFLIMCTIVLLFLTIWVIFPLPKIISRITLIYLSTEVRAQVAIGFLSIIELIYIISNYEINNKDKIINKKNIKLVLISIISTLIIIFISNYIIKIKYPDYNGILKTTTSIILFLTMIFLFLYNHQKTNKILCFILIFTSLISGLFVSPLNKGLNSMYDKPIAKQIKNIIKTDKDAKFLAADGTILTANYIAVNGASTINTVNHLPNLTLYHKLDPSKKYENIYNRYEHVAVYLTDKKTTFKLQQSDYIIINLSKNDVCKISADYIVVNTNDTSNYQSYQIIYGQNSQTKIYKTNCK